MWTGGREGGGGVVATNWGNNFCRGVDPSRHNGQEFQNYCKWCTVLIVMLSRKTYARKLRAHFLVQSALKLILLQFISPYGEQCRDG